LYNVPFVLRKDIVVRLRREIDGFIVAKKQEGLSAATLRQYGWHLDKLAEYWEEHWGDWHVERDDVQQEDLLRSRLREWGASLVDCWSPATVKQAVTACRSLFRWLEEEGVLDTNPAEGLKLPKVPVRIQRTLTLDEVRAMLEVCDLDTVKGIRDCALLHVLIDTGLRAAEVCRLRSADVHLEQRFLTVIVKGGREDVAYFGESTARSIQCWLDVRSAAPVVEELFTAVGGGRPGRELTTRGLRTIVKQIGEVAGVEGVSPHAFRRGFAVIATEAGAPSRVVQVAGRWSNITMVERYTLALQRGHLHGRWSPADRVNGGDEDA
jgi:site-specific recombinase XerD